MTAPADSSRTGPGGHPGNRRSGPGQLSLSAARLGALLPFHLWCGPDQRIISVGPTLHKIAGGGLVGASLADVALIRRPLDTSGLDDLLSQGTTPVSLVLDLRPSVEFKGQFIPLAPRQGGLFNLSPGIGVMEVVRRFALTADDFSPADLAVELLSLAEAQSMILDESRNLNRRLEHARDEAKRMALSDPLTGLWNRRAMLDLLQSLVAGRGRERFGLMHIDLDHFKAVNDTQGHAAGDHILTRVAEILKSETRRGDLVARVGGDEFVVIFRDFPDHQALDAIARRIIRRLEEPIPFNGALCRISASIGTTLSDLYRQRGEELQVERVMDDADLATYASKNGGRGRHTLFDPALRLAR